MARQPGRGGGTAAALALAAATLSVASPMVLIFVPLALLLMALPPRRPGLVVAGALGAVLVFRRVPVDPLGAAELGWVFVLGGWFVLLAALRPGATFLGKALAALAGAVATAAVVLAARPGAWAVLDWSVARHFRDVAAMLASVWGAAAESESFAARVVDGFYRTADLQAMLYPALLALASLAGLGVAWWAHRRLSGVQSRVFAPFREFRFHDELVWLLIAGILLVVLPLGGAAPRAGSNLVAFMGTLYALRGAAVLLAVTGAPGAATVALGLLALLILPMVMLGTAMVGLADTWIDLRARRTAAGSGS
ncbi:MAG TPA: DUF2232 domain-containing protein [Longimicrobiales bacterium]